MVAIYNAVRTGLLLKRKKNIHLKVLSPTGKVHKVVYPAILKRRFKLLR